LLRSKIAAHCEQEKRRRTCDEVTAIVVRMAEENRGWLNHHRMPVFLLADVVSDVGAFMQSVGLISVTM